MKLENSFDLLNSEGSIIKIEKYGCFWHYRFKGTNVLTVTSNKEILNSLLKGKGIVNKSEGKIYFLEDYPISMRGDSPEYYERIARILIQEEMEKCKNDINYFKENYLGSCK
jgi:hypothetical protein